MDTDGGVPVNLPPFDHEPTAEEVQQYVAKRVEEAMNRHIGQPVTDVMIDVVKAHIEAQLKDLERMGLIPEPPPLYYTMDKSTGTLWVEDLATYLKRINRHGH